MNRDGIEGGAWRIRVAVVLGALGTLSCLALLLKETPETFVAFMFLAQPLLGASFALFVWEVVTELRHKRVL